MIPIYINETNHDKKANISRVIAPIRTLAFIKIITETLKYVVYSN